MSPDKVSELEWTRNGPGKELDNLTLLFQNGNRIEGEYHDMMFLTNPMVSMSLVIEDGVQFSPPLEQTKEIMVNCLKEIVENTQNFPRLAFIDSL